jgi:hypothetical protein
MTRSWESVQLSSKFSSSPYFSFPARDNIAGNPPSDIFLFLQADIAQKEQARTLGTSTINRIAIITQL